MGNSSGSMNVFTIMTLSIMASCFLLSFCGYIITVRKNRKRHQINFINQTYAPEVQEQVFTIDMSYTQPSTPHLSDMHPPSYPIGEISAPTDTSSIANDGDQMEEK